VRAYVGGGGSADVEHELLASCDQIRSVAEARAPMASSQGGRLDFGQHSAAAAVAREADDVSSAQVQSVTGSGGTPETCAAHPASTPSNRVRCHRPQANAVIRPIQLRTLPILSTLHRDGP